LTVSAGARYSHPVATRSASFAHRHLVGIADLDAAAIGVILDLADRYQAIAAEPVKKLRPCAARPSSTCSSRTRPGPGRRSSSRPSG
jgi:hypothetical protein